MLKGMSGRYPLSAIRYPLSAIRYSLLCSVSALLLACAPKGEALYQRAEQSLQQGEVRAAVIDLKNLVRDEPSNAKARALLALAMAQDGDLDGAAIEVQKARDLGAAAGTLLVADCTVKAARGEFDAVLEQCQPDAVTAAEQPAINSARGMALLGLNRPVEAKAPFASALAAEPDRIEALLGLATVEYSAGGLPAARAVLDGAPDKIKEQSRYWLALGAMSMQGDDPAAAEQSLQKALDSVAKGAPGSERLIALGALAEAQLRNGKLKEATASAAQLAKLAPDNPLVKQLRGQIAMASGKLDEARTLLEEAVAAMPDDVQARTALGVVNLKQGNLGQAEMHFANVVAKYPGDVRAQRLLAETRARLGSPEDSLASLAPELGKADADPALLAMAGRMSLVGGNRDEALAYLNQAAAPGGPAQPPEVQLEIVSGYMMAGQFDRAIELLEQMPQDGKVSVQRESLLLLALMRKGETDKALAEGKALLERSGNDVNVRNLVGGLYAAAGQRDAAREQFNAALKIEPANLGALVNLGRLDLMDGRSADAERWFRRVLEADPKSMVGVAGMAAVAGARGDTRATEKWLVQGSREHPDLVQAQLALAQYYVGQREFDKAKAVIDAAVKTFPNHATLSSARGFALLGAMNLPGAIASFSLATEQAPKVPAHAINLARAHIANRDANSALAVLNGLLKDNPRFQPALALAAATALQAGMVEQATGYVERMRQVAPDAAITQALEGELAFAQKQYREALGHYRKASAQGGTTQLVAAQYRAARLANEPRPEKVLEDWLAAHPGDPGVLVMLAEHRQMAGDSDGTIALYEEALKSTPGNAVVLNNLAQIYLDKGDERAAALAARAYELQPRVPAIQDTYGWALFKQGKTDKAVDLLRGALNGMPDHAEVQYHLAAALTQQGNKAEALKLLQKAQRGTLPPHAKADARKLLEQLQK